MGETEQEAFYVCNNFLIQKSAFFIQFWVKGVFHLVDPDQNLVIVLRSQ